MWCIKKKGLQLTSQTITYEDDYWEPSELDAQLTTRFEWVEDSDLADTFIDWIKAENYLAMNTSEF